MNMSNTTTFPYKLEKVATLSEHTERVWSCAWSPGGKYLLTTSSDCTARIWTCKDLPNTTDASSQDESAVVEASGSPGQTWTCVQVLSGVHTRTIRYGAWSPTGRYLALCSFDRSISIWEQEDGGTFHSADTPGDIATITTPSLFPPITSFPSLRS